MRRYTYSTALTAVATLAACKDNPIQPEETTSVTATAVLGAAITDTIDAQLTQALVLELRNASGNPVKGVLVRFQTQARTDTVRRNERALYICIVNAPTCRQPDLSTVDYTDSTGRAKVTVRFGTLAGKGVVRYLVPEFGLIDSTTYTVNPGAAKRLRVPVDTALEIGSTVTLRGRVVDRAENTRPESVTLSAGAGTAFTLDVATGVASGREFGMQWAFYRSSALVDSTNVGVVPVGRLAAITASDQLRVLNTDGRNVRSFSALVLGGGGVRFDATRERLTLYGQYPPFISPNPLIVVFDTLGAAQRQLFTSIDLNSILAVRRLANGDILVAAQRNSIQGYTLFRITADNAVSTVVDLPGLRSIPGSADISPDGSRVVYAAPAGLGTPELRVLSVATGQFQAFDPNVSSPRISPQGNRIAYLAGGTVPTIVNTDGTGKRTLSPTALLSSGLAWAPDETYILGNPLGSTGFRFIRISDGASVSMHYRSETGVDLGYRQADWR